DRVSLRVEEFSSRVGAHHLIDPVASLRILKQRNESCAIGIGAFLGARRRHISMRQEMCRHEVRCVRARLGMTGPAYDQRHPISFLLRNPSLDPHTMRADHIAMIGSEYD